MTPTWESPCGLVQLYLGDCLEVLPTLNSVDAVITDPPYGINRENHGGLLETRQAIDNDDSQDYGHAVVDYAVSRGIPLAVFASPRLPFAGEWRNVICWDKGEAVAGGGDPRKCLKLSWELIQVSGNGNINGGRIGSVWRHTLTQKDFEHHPNQKPLGLMHRLISTLFDSEEMIVDPFMGSGTTCLAALQLGRKFTGVEVNATYFEIAKRRIMEFLHMEVPQADGSTQQLLFKNGGLT